MKIRRRQLILASLVVALGAAVYLNWQFSNGEKNFGLNNVWESAKELGEAKYVNSSVDDDELKETMAPLSEESKKFFEKARENKQKNHEEAIESIKNIYGSEKEKGEKQALEFAANLEKESNIENLIKAKGFSECMAFIQNSECRIIVSPGNLDESAAIVIRDIVAGQTGLPFEKITITEAK